MKKLSWLLLAALPYQAVASVEDPVAQPCYMCTDAEMYAKARSLGVGSHYVYQAASQTNIQGFTSPTRMDSWWPRISCQHLGYARSTTR